MTKNASQIPVHKLRDRQSSGISVQYTNSDAIIERQHIMRAHRDDHYMFFFQHCGTSNFVVDFKEMIIGGNVVFCVLPGQVHYFKSSEAAKGWFLAIDTLLVEQQYRNVFEDEILHLTPLLISNQEGEHLEKCFQALHQITNNSASAIRQGILSNLSGACIGLIAEAYLAREEKQLSSSNRSTTIARQFRALLKHNFRTIKSPSQYAACLNLSLSYLNECVNSTTGMPVSVVIHQEIILEAKRLLYYSDLTIKEIAYDLGFGDHAYFSRLFSNITGTTPSRFRKSYHE